MKLFTSAKVERFFGFCKEKVKNRTETFFLPTYNK